MKQLKGMTIEHNMPWCQSVKSCYLITMSRKESCIFMMVLWRWTWTRNLFLWTAGFTASFHFSNNICCVRIIDVGVVISSYYHLMGREGGHSFIRIREFMV